MPTADTVTACRTCGAIVPAGLDRCTVCEASLDGSLTMAPRRVLPVDPASTVPEMPAGLLDRFVLEGDLGSGGMGMVKLARDTRLDRLVAIKLIRNPDDDLIARFELEAKLMAGLEHENLVRVYDYGIAAGVPYLVMEYVRGSTLTRRVNLGRPTLVETARIAIDILTGIGVAHERGIVHRDLKPGNVFLDATGRAKVADFGLALQVESTAASGGERITGDGLIMGTPGYMAPEVIHGERARAAADVYAVGVMLHEMLTGQRLYPGENLMTIVSAQVRGNVPPPSLSNPIVPAAFDELVQRALALDPAQRIAGPELAASLARWLDRGSRQARPGANADLPPRPYKLLEHFTPQDVPIYFGRDAEAAELVELVENPRGRVAFVFGPCGIGKSSLLRAGFLPRLDPARLEPVVLVSGPDPARQIRETVAALALRHKITLPSGEEIRPGLLERKPRLLVELLMLIHGVTGRTPVLIIDQLEELFTQNARDAKRIATFFELVCRLVEAQALPVRLVLSYRTEFRGDFFPLEDRLARLQLSFQVREMGPDGLREAIEGPSRLEAYGFRFARGLPERIAADIVETTRAVGDAALPLLQIICSQLYERIREKGGGLIDAELFASVVGGARGALQRYVEQRLASPGYNRRGAIARQMLAALTGKEEGGVRFSRPRDEEELLAFPDRDAARQTLERLVGDHLVVRDAGTEGKRVVRLASEVICGLVETWTLEPDDTERASRILQWTSRQWREHGRRAEDLLAGGLLQFVQQHMGALKGVESVERAYVEEAARRRERRFRNMFVAFGALITVLVASTLWVVSSPVRDRMHATLRQAVEQDRKTLRALLEIELVQLEVRARVVANEPHFIALVDTDATTLADGAPEFFARTKADLMAVSSQKTLLCSLPVTGTHVDSAAEVPGPAPGGRWPRRATLFKDGQLFLTSTVPIGIGVNTPGRLMVGLRIKESLAESLKDVGQGDMVFAVGKRVVSSTLTGLGPGTQVPEPDAAGEILVGGGRYLAAVETLAQLPEGPARCLLLRDLEPSLGFLSRLQRLGLVVWAAAVAVALAVSWWLTRSVSRWV